MEMAQITNLSCALYGACRKVYARSVSSKFIKTVRSSSQNIRFWVVWHIKSFKTPNSKKIKTLIGVLNQGTSLPGFKSIDPKMKGWRKTLIVEEEEEEEEETWQKQCLPP